jgi:hypothetical protein
MREWFATGSDAIDLPTAVQSLKKMAHDLDNQDVLRAMRALEEKPGTGKGDPMHPQWYKFYYGSPDGWELSLRTRTWQLTVHPEGGTFRYFGEFRRVPNGEWTAVITSSGPQATREKRAGND